MTRYTIGFLTAATATVCVALAGCETTPAKQDAMAMKKVDSGQQQPTNVSQKDWTSSDVVTAPCPLNEPGREGGPCEATPPAAAPAATAPAPVSTAAKTVDAELKELTMGGMCKGQSPDLPQAANAGQCFAKVWNEPKYNVIATRTLVKPASERIEVVPARYEKVKEPVVVKPATKEYRTIPAQYETVTEKVLVREAYVRTETIPAVYDVIEEKQLVKPAYKTWKPGTMTNIQRVDESGQIMCLVEVPAEYQTVTKRVLRSNEQTKRTQVPAEYAEVQKTVLKSPEQVETIEVPAVTEMREFDKLVEPAKQVKVPVGAEYAEVPTQQLAVQGCHEWRQILCDNNMTQGTITSLQAALTKKGYYKGESTGKFDDDTLAAVNAYERANNLPIDGYLNVETAESLGLSIQ